MDGKTDLGNGNRLTAVTNCKLGQLVAYTCATERGPNSVVFIRRNKQMIEFIIGAVIGVGIGFLIGVAACIWLLSGEEDGAWEQPYASAMGDGDEE